MQTRLMLDKIFTCQTCGASILFESDRNEHKKAGPLTFIIHDPADGNFRIEKGEELDL